MTVITAPESVRLDRQNSSLSAGPSAGLSAGLSTGSSASSAGSATESVAARALRSAYHLQCVQGPDAGGVLPLVDGWVVGRGRDGLADPYLSRIFCQVHVPQPGNAPHSSEPRSKPGSKASRALEGAARGRVGELRPKHQSVGGLRKRLFLRRTSQVRMGSSVWLVTARPTSLNWPVKEVGPRSGPGLLRVTRFILPLMLIGFLWRMVPSPVVLWVLAAIATVVAGSFLWARGQRWARFTEAALLLVLTARAGNYTTSKDGTGKDEAGTRGSGGNRISSGQQTSVRVLRRPGAPDTVEIALGSQIAVVGPGSHAYAQWIVGQLLAGGYAAEVADPAAPATGLSAAGSAIYPVESVADVPLNVASVLPAHSVGSPGWTSAVGPLIGTEETLPTKVDFTDLAGVPTPDLVKEYWRGSRAGWQPLTAPIGKDGTGTVVADLAQAGPHALVVGGTGSGKSELLSTLVLSLALSASPEQLKMVLIDYKGGAGLGHLAELPHVEHLFTDLEAGDTPWLLRTIEAALQRRKEACAAAGFRSVAQWREAFTGDGNEAPPPRLLIVVDEFRVLAETFPHYLSKLTALATQGRSLDMHLVAASQRSGGALPADLRAALDLRIALRVTEPQDSLEVLGTPKAAELPRIPGRAIMASHPFQTALVTDAAAWVAAMIQAAASAPAEASQQIPDPLPPQTAAVPGQAGLYEEPADGSSKPLTVPLKPVLFLGPPTVNQELRELALITATTPQQVEPDLAGYSDTATSDVRQLVWLGAAPALGPETFLAASQDPAQIIHVLQRITRAGAPKATLVIADYSELVTQLEAAVNPTQLHSLLRDLFQAAAAKNLRLLATDTKPKADGSQFPVRAFRIPGGQGALSPELLTQLAASVPTGQQPLTQTAEEAASATWGRIILTGWHSLGPVRAQFSPLSQTVGIPDPRNPDRLLPPPPAPPAPPPPQPTPSLRAGGSSPESWVLPASFPPPPPPPAAAKAGSAGPIGTGLRWHGLTRRAHHASAAPSSSTRSPRSRATEPRNTVADTGHDYELPWLGLGQVPGLSKPGILIADTKTAAALQADDRHPWLREYQAADPAQWTMVLRQPESNLIAIRPGREVLRHLATLHPQDALWAEAGYPYPAGTGIAATQTGLFRIET